MNMLFSQNPITIGFDRFITGKDSKLLIVGLSGAGKSTLGKYRKQLREFRSKRLKLADQNHESVVWSNTEL